MKNLLIITLLGLFISLNLHANLTNENLESTMSIMAQKLMDTQKSDGRIEGVFEADPGFELLSLVFLRQNGVYEPKIEKQFIEKALKWKTELGFGSYPHGPYNHDVTGVALLSIQYLGYDLAKLNLISIKNNFDNNGGIKKLNIGTKMLLAPLGLVSSQLLNKIITPALQSIPSLLPFSNKSLGIFRSLLIPLSAWNFYYHKNNNTKALIALDSDEENAKESIQWILNHQMENGTWYTLFHAIVNVSALKEAQKYGLGNYQKEINNALSAIINWRTINNFGEISQQLTLTTGWDTPQSLMAMNELPKNIKSKFEAKIKKAVLFLDKNQINEVGDWGYNSPSLTPGGWSFIVENKDYPDTDVVAAVLESKLASPKYSSNEAFKKGLNWILNLQNDDGGFPAWEKNVSKVTTFLMNVAIPDMPDYSDLSQADVTSRIIRLLNKLKDNPEYSEYNLENIINKSCHFIKRQNLKHHGLVIEGRWLIGYLYGTTEALDSLLATNCINLKQAENSIRFILHYQNSDGGFGEDHSSLEKNEIIKKESTVMQTSYIVHGLIAFEEAYLKSFHHYSKYKPQLDLAMEYLINTSKKNNGFIKEKSFSGVIAAGLWYADYGLSPQFMSLRAIGRYYRLLNQ